MFWLPMFNSEKLLWLKQNNSPISNCLAIPKHESGIVPQLYFQQFGPFATNKYFLIIITLLLLFPCKLDIIDCIILPLQLCTTYLCSTYIVIKNWNVEVPPQYTCIFALHYYYYIGTELFNAMRYIISH